MWRRRRPSRVAVIADGRREGGGRATVGVGSVVVSSAGAGGCTVLDLDIGYE